MGDGGSKLRDSGGAARAPLEGSRQGRPPQPGSDGGRRRSNTAGAETRHFVPSVDPERYASVAKAGECPTVKPYPKSVRILGMRFLDPSLSKCTACHEKFTATYRKHWCRRCGRIFCDACTSKRQQLWTAGPFLRVCKNCSTPALFQLPINVLQMIFGFFEDRTLSRALATCKRFQLGINVPFQEISNIHEFYDRSHTRYLQKGAFGSVYSAVAHHTGTPVAIKVIDKYNVHTLREWGFIKREIELHSKLRHPNIVTLHHVYQTRSKVYIVMDLGTGDLFDYMIKRGFMTEREVVSIAVQILGALDYLHRECHVVHRDIKPENILVFPSPDQQRTLHARPPNVIVKLCDLGLAKSFEASDVPSPVQNTPCGTLIYCPPEVLAKKKETTTDRLTKLDIFSLGIVLHVLVTGAEPFRGRTPQELLKGMRHPVLATGPEWKSVSSTTRGLVLGMLQFDSTLRPTAHEALQRLVSAGQRPPSIRDPPPADTSPRAHRAQPPPPQPAPPPPDPDPPGSGGIGAMLAAAQRNGTYHAPDSAAQLEAAALSAAEGIAGGLGTAPIVDSEHFAQRVTESLRKDFDFRFELDDKSGGLVIDRVERPQRRRGCSSHDGVGEDVALGLECLAENLEVGTPPSGLAGALQDTPSSAPRRPSRSVSAGMLDARGVPAPVGELQVA
eukprot:TRINITY_DN4802_c1_g2_i1.p1 TRINITY_DN4802_c1_g2~~TRINITY_DN4802_c1_g2_i1.p1  ORF type:complete len:698 (+),score=199.33 TRINITY_DN4802_c1_g2_i1:79-2094(+)